MWPATLLAPPAGPLEADAAAQLAPVRWIEGSELGAYRHANTLATRPFSRQGDLAAFPDCREFHKPYLSRSPARSWRDEVATVTAYRATTTLGIVLWLAASATLHCPA